MHGHTGKSFLVHLLILFCISHDKNTLMSLLTRASAVSYTHRLATSCQTSTCLTTVSLQSDISCRRIRHDLIFWFLVTKKFDRPSDGRNFYSEFHACITHVFTSDLDILTSDITVSITLWHEGLYQGIQEINVKCL
jgi:hypothetical protein